MVIFPSNLLDSFSVVQGTVQQQKCATSNDSHEEAPGNSSELNIHTYLHLKSASK